MQTIKLLPVGQKFPINEKLAGIVPMALPSEQEALTTDIKNNGQREPVVLWKGEIVDGRCRQKACLLAGKPIMAKDLDDELTEDEVKTFVKSVNTRRNLTATQKIIVACKESFTPAAKSVAEIAVSWGISTTLLKNARYIYTERPDFIEPLFNGLAVPIVDKNNKPILSNKVSAVYAHVKREKENITMIEEHGWNEESLIKTQVGKDWFYDQKALIEERGIEHAIKLVALIADKVTRNKSKEDSVSDYELYGE
jgi:hypothetical protein